MSNASETQDRSGEGAMDRVAKSQLAAPSLESLPAELRLRVLSNMPDLESLGSLIHASPVYLAQYRLDRESILSCFLDADMGREVLIDAIAAFRSQPSKAGPLTRPNSNVTDFLDLYGWWRYTRSPIAMLNSVSLADLRWIMCNHMSTVRPLASQVINMTFTFLTSAAVYVESWRAREESRASGPANVWPDLVSRTERTRILRALYRLQIFCNLFGGQQYQSFTCEEIQHMFFCQYDAWEVEEMNCVSEWIHEEWLNIVVAAGWDWSKLEDSLRLDGWSHEYYNATMGRGGLRFVLDMFESDDHNKRVELVSKYFTREEVPCFFDECMFASEQNQRKHHAVNEFCKKDLAERRREPMQFRGDENSCALLNGEADPDNESIAQAFTTCGPPFAWVVIWNGKYCNLYGEYLPRLFREWGYVLWDESRWNTIERARQMLSSNWALSREYQLVKDHFDWLGDLP